jgi:signal transduction histidine kinase
MVTSRLRLRLAGGFSLAFAIALTVLAAGALGYLWRESNLRLDARLDTVASNVVTAFEREIRDEPDSSLRFAARQVVDEWPRNDDGFVIIDRNGDTLAVNAPRLRPSERVKNVDAGRRIFLAWHARPSARFDVDDHGPDFRVVALPATVRESPSSTRDVTVLAFASTEGIESDTELLGVSLAIAAPLILLLSLTAGYLLARGALLPVTRLAEDIASIAPSDLSRRLPIDPRQDEISTLATEFNALLIRLDEAQRRNRDFILETAHQIRTPLTLVLGEAAHELALSDSSEAKMRATLGRIRTAADHMRRRVDDLFLLAEAQSGEPLRLEDDVELDGLVLECADLMRGRAMALGRSLAIGTAEPVVIRGSAALLQEAVLELLENACRHGEAHAPVVISCRAQQDFAIIEVASAGNAFELPPDATSGSLVTTRTLTRGAARANSGLGLAIVRWVAESHGGSLKVRHDSAGNVVSLSLRGTRG